MSKSSLALHNLRAVVILIVVAFHSVLAYLGSAPAAPYRFDDPPHLWRAFPIVDSERWYGFDLFCAWQDVYLMPLMFFLSALFVWPSLTRKGSRQFLSERSLRLGLPFICSMLFLMPLALYPVYRTTAADPNVSAYLQHYLALDFWPVGPQWFLWQLLVLHAAAAALYRLAPRHFARLVSVADRSPFHFFTTVSVLCALAYVPLALMFSPWTWVQPGPFSLQLSRPLLYTVIFFVGVGVGARGLDRGLLAPDGALSRHWKTWLAVSFGSLCVWIGFTALTMGDEPAPLFLRFLAYLAFAPACVSGGLFLIAVCLHFGQKQWPLFQSLGANAYGIYLIHYISVIWLQYALLGVVLLAPAKAAIVFAGALALSWATTVAVCRIPFGARIVGAERRVATS